MRVDICLPQCRGSLNKRTNKGQVKLIEFVVNIKGRNKKWDLLLNSFRFFQINLSVDKVEVESPSHLMMEHGCPTMSTFY